MAERETLLEKLGSDETSRTAGWTVVHGPQVRVRAYPLDPDDALFIVDGRDKGIDKQKLAPVGAGVRFSSPLVSKVE